MEDRLSTLHIDILLCLCRQLSERDSLDHLDILSRESKLETAAGSLRGITAGGLKVPIPGHSLPGTCQRLRSFCNNMRTSISFRAEKQARAASYMQKLPNLTAVTITYSGSRSGRHSSCKQAYAIRDSLTSLHTCFPNLTSLTLKYVNPDPRARTSRPAAPWEHGASEEDNPGLEADMAALLLPWSGTLLRLDLDNIKCKPYAGANMTGLRFLSHLTALQALSLRSVQPTLEVEDIAGCTGLLQLTLIHAEGYHNDTLDLSAFPTLQEVCCERYGLKDLNIDGLTALQRLECDRNRIALLNLSTCRSLRHLTCSGNCMKHLDVATCPLLEVLECDSNPLSQLYVTGCSLLTGLSCVSQFCTFTELALSSCASLQALRCSMRELGILDLQVCPDLRLLYVRCMQGCDNPVALNLAGLTCLEKVSFERSSLTSLDLARCTSLRHVNCENSMALAALRVSGCSRLQTLMVEGCALQCLDLTSCVELRTLHLRETPLEMLDLSACVRLKEVKCSGSNIRCLDVSAAAASLVTLWSDRCLFLEVLRATGCGKLETLWCGKCPLLRELSCQGCDSLPQIWCRESGRFDGQTIASLRAADWRVGEQVCV